MEECSETSVYKIQMPGNYQEESIQHSEHGESLKSRIKITVNEITCPSVKWRRIRQGWVLVRAMMYFAVWKPSVFGT